MSGFDFLDCTIMYVVHKFNTLYTYVAIDHALHN